MSHEFMKNTPLSTLYFVYILSGNNTKTHTNASEILNEKFFQCDCLRVLVMCGVFVEVASNIGAGTFCC